MSGNSCSEISCSCSEFKPNMFQKNICKECYHVLSKHGQKKEENISTNIQTVQRFIESPKSSRIQKTQPRYPSIRTLSEQFKKISDEKQDINNKKQETKKISSPNRNIKINTKSKRYPVKNNRNINNNNNPGRIPVIRSATDASLCRKAKNEDEINRLSTTFIEEKPIRNKKTLPKPKLPPPESLPTLPPPPPKPETMKIETTTNNSPVKQKPYSTNKKRHAIRHEPNANYADMFSTRIKTPVKEKSLKNLEESLRIDPRKLKKRSLTYSNRSSRKSNDCINPVSTFPNKLSDKNAKRRSSLPLELKLNAIGIEIPPVILNIILYEPSKQPRTIQISIDESENPSVATILHQLSQELISLQSSIGTPTYEPIYSPSSKSRKRTKFGIIGQFRKKRKDDDTSLSPTASPKLEGLSRIKDFGLYWPAKDEWLDATREITSYCFRDLTTLEYKRRVRNFKLRVQYEIKVLFTQYGWNKTITISPHVITVSNIRYQIIEWLKEEDYYSKLPLSQCDESLSLFGIYLNGNLMEDEDKILRTYNIRQKDTLEIKINPGYSFKVISTITNDNITIHSPVKASFNDLIDKLIIEQFLESNENISITLPSPLGTIDKNSLEFSRAMFKSDDEFILSCNLNKLKVIVTRVPKDSWIKAESQIPFDIILEGEKVIKNSITEHVTIFHFVRGKKTNIKYSGTLMLSNYRILLKRKFQGGKDNSDWIDIPLTSINYISKVKSKDKELRKHCLDIFCKSVRKVTIGFVDSIQRNHNFTRLSDIISKHTPQALFAFSHTTKSDEIKPGWDIYDIKSEYARMGVFSYSEDRYGWRLTKLNHDYSMSKSYPKLFAVPATVSDEIILATSLFRTKARIPVLTWLHPLTGVCLFRSSQPKVGIQRNTSKQDQQFLYEISMQGTMNQNTAINKTKQLHVFDARPMKAAVGNQVMGAGFESENTGYGFCHSHFLNIDNIHFVRESFTKLQELCISSVEEDTNVYTHWLEELDATNWFYLLSRILVGAKRIAKLLADETSHSPCLIHCSDGWDRTSQLSALSQLLIDPYYRTYHGFQILICKDWLSFGHQIAFRMGHNYGGKEEPEQQAPIFLQFLDCVFQLTVQFPTSFEFSESLLCFIHDEVINCRFGTFLMNCEREREEARLAYRTKSIWEYLEIHKDKYLNPFYKETTKTVELLSPNCEIPNICLWHSYYFQHLDMSETPREVMEKRVKELQNEIENLKKQLEIKNRNEI